VEKDEVSSWTRVGFVREGTIPGFYKRSDGHLCGCVIGDKTASIEVGDEENKLAERTLTAAKKAGKDIPDAIKGAGVRWIEEKDAIAARDAAWKKKEAIGSFEPFGRDAEHLFLDATYKRSKTNYVCAEFQDCFGHALVEVLRSPTSPNEVIAVTEALRVLADDLTEKGIVAGFAFAPIDDVDLATAYLAAGYRKTGLLAQGVQVGNERKDAILFTRKLANPAADDPE